MDESTKQGQARTGRDGEITCVESTSTSITSTTMGGPGVHAALFSMSFLGSWGKERPWERGKRKEERGKRKEGRVGSLRIQASRYLR
ncbi:hypothetical protein WAI453_005742 [Rhynchosporium graminicola]